MSLENIEEIIGMTLSGESLREEEVEKDAESFTWHADILTQEDFWEIEMMYIFNDPDQELLEKLENTPTAYNCKMTDGFYYPTIDHQNGETRVFAYMPIKQSLDHEIAKFPSQYLEELRDGFYREAISGE